MSTQRPTRDRARYARPRRCRGADPPLPQRAAGTPREHWRGLRAQAAVDRPGARRRAAPPSPGDAGDPGDGHSYGVALDRGAALLYKGEDFRQTPIAAAAY